MKTKLPINADIFKIFPPDPTPGPPKPIDPKILIRLVQLNNKAHILAEYLSKLTELYNSLKTRVTTLEENQNLLLDTTSRDLSGELAKTLATHTILADKEYLKLFECSLVEVICNAFNQLSLEKDEANLRPKLKASYAKCKEVFEKYNVYHQQVINYPREHFKYINDIIDESALTLEILDNYEKFLDGILRNAKISESALKLDTLRPNKIEGSHLLKELDASLSSQKMFLKGGDYSVFKASFTFFASKMLTSKDLVVEFSPHKARITNLLTPLRPHLFMRPVLAEGNKHSATKELVKVSVEVISLQNNCIIL